MHHAAVDQQRIRTLVKPLVSVEIVPKAAGQHLPHGSVIVLIVHIFELKALVIALFRLAVRKNHHGGNDVRARNVGNVVCLQAARRFGKAKHRAEQRQRSADPFGGGGGAFGFLAGILVRKLDQLAAVSALWGKNADLPIQLFQQELRKQLRVVDRARKQDPLRCRAAPQVILLQKRRDRLALVLGKIQKLVVLVHQVATDKMQHRKAGLCLRRVPADHVGIRHRRGGDELALGQQLDCINAVAKLRSLFKFQPLRCLLHLCPKRAGQLLVLSLQERNTLVDQPSILPLRFFGTAPAVAEIHL